MGEPIPGSARRYRKPPVLLLLRARRSLERVLLPAAGVTGVFHRHRRQVRSASALSLRHHRHQASLERRARSGSGTSAGLAGQRKIQARFVFSAVGSLNIPKLPDIPGMDTFTGPSFHSARWPDDLELAGKRFALVGAGASGFQIGPAIADDCGSAHDLPAHRAVDHPESALPRTGAPRGQVGTAAPTLLRAVVPVHHDVRRHCCRHRPLSDRPGYRTRQVGRSTP